MPRSYYRGLYVLVLMLRSIYTCRLGTVRLVIEQVLGSKGYFLYLPEIGIGYEASMKSSLPMIETALLQLKSCSVILAHFSQKEC